MCFPTIVFLEKRLLSFFSGRALGALPNKGGAVLNILVGAGCVKALRGCYTHMGRFWQSPRFIPMLCKLLVRYCMF